MPSVVSFSACCVHFFLAESGEFEFLFLFLVVFPHHDNILGVFVPRSSPRLDVGGEVVDAIESNHQVARLDVQPFPRDARGYQQIGGSFSKRCDNRRLVLLSPEEISGPC